MEDALAPTAPPAPIAAAAAPSAAPTTLFLTRRRSHLDSASFRTLSRLFSHFLHLQPSQDGVASHPEVEPAAANPIGDTGESPKAGSPPKDAEFNPGKDVEEAAVGVTFGPETPAPAGAATNPIANLGVAPQGSPGREVAGVEPVESLEEIVLSVGGPELVKENEALRSMKACLEGEAEESLQVAVCNGDEHLLLDAMMTNFSGLIDDASVGTIPIQSCGVSRDEPQNDNKVAEGVKEFGCRTKEDRPVSNSDHRLVDGDGFEEGEIEGDMQALDAEESGDLELEDKHADDRKLEGDYATRESGENESSGRDIRCLNLLSALKIKEIGDLVRNKEGNMEDNAQMHVPRAQTVSYDEVVEWNETPLHDAEAPRPGKRKRQLTEERKAKKTKNKRIKRALQREADGVKRLKLAPIIKPKVVKDCRFYLHGKCQQGNACKFSHDTTPLTKSKPCTHFARGSCLKGDDCPYDHELSKYPCHNFLENGMCARRDKCKFSHVVPTADGPSTQDTNKSDASLVPKKAIDREQTSIQRKSTLPHGEPVTSAPTKHFSILKNLSGISLNAEKVSARIPNGVRFLPFSKDRSDSSILHQDALSTTKHRYTNGNQNQNFGGPQAIKEDTNAKPIRQKSAMLFDEKNSSKVATSHPCSEPKKTSLPIDSTAVPGSVNIQHEVSEASRILQEFLFVHLDYFQ